MGWFRRRNRSNLFWIFFSVFAAVLLAVASALEPVYLFIVGAIIILVLLPFVTTSIWDIKQRKKFMENTVFPIIYVSADHDWRIDQDGSFLARNVYKVKNISKKRTDLIPTDDGIWVDELSQLSIKFGVIDHNGSRYKIKTYTHSVYERLVGYFSGASKKFVSWSTVISPPLGPGDEVTFELEISSQGTELAAFSEEGTYLGIPTNIPTQNATIRCIAPKDFRFEILEPVVVVHSETLEADLDAVQGVAPPELSAARTVLSWSISDPLHRRRYWTKYRLVRVKSDAA